MGDDWRLTVDFDDEANGAQLVERLHAREFASEERRRLGDGVIVSRDSACVYFYMGSEKQALEVENVVRFELEKKRERPVVTLERWHPVEEEWRDASAPLPSTAREVEVEHERREAREEADALATGRADWEVRIELPGHAETEELCDRLEAEGIPVVRRSTFLLVGAATEDDANALSERLRAEAPPSAKLHVQPGGEMVWEVTPQNPFAILGGLGG